MNLTETGQAIARDMEAAHAEWGANCGPSALAAITCQTLAQVRPHLGDFEKKGYTNPTLMFAALASMRREFRSIRPSSPSQNFWPSFGLVRIQWHGPWMDAGVHYGARYRKSHWIGAMRSQANGVGIFDCNALANGTGWCGLKNWEEVIVPFILESYPKANGLWSITHMVEVDRCE